MNKIYALYLMASFAILVSCAFSTESSTLTDPSQKNLVITGEIGYSHMEDLADRIAFANGVSSTGIKKNGNTYTLSFDRDLTVIPKEAFTDEPITAIIIPHGVLKIEAQAFWSCEKLISVSMPNTLKSIEWGAFNDCPITKITLPDNLQEIGSYCFSGTHIKKIVIPERITSIKYNAFSDCGELEEVHLPDNLVAIEKEAFDNCKKLSKINFPQSLQRIDARAFMRHSFTKIVLPSSVKEIEEYAFFTDNTSFIIDVPVGVEYINADAFGGAKEIIVHSEEHFNKVMHYQRNTKITLAEEIVADKEKEDSLPIAPPVYVDLGLPSGTLWKDKNEDGYFTFDQAVSQFGSSLPSRSEWKELMNVCQWSWIDSGVVSGYRVTGTNGESIFLPAEGSRDSDGRRMNNVGSGGEYWSSSVNREDYAWNFTFFPHNMDTRATFRSYGFSVRLVQR